MGYGKRLGIDMPDEVDGFIPSSTTYNTTRNNRWSSGSIISIAIGQGEVTATPLQMCNLAATIANRGYYIIPHVVRNIQDMPLESQYRERKYSGIQKEYYDLVVEGMRAAVTGGTCNMLNFIYSLDICAKTGTVQNPHGRDHSACIAFAPKDEPKVAISVFVENGGTGAQLSIPIARLMLSKYLRGEIYNFDQWLEDRTIIWDTSPGSPFYIKKIVVEDEHDEL